MRKGAFDKETVYAGYVTNPERLTKTLAQKFQQDGGVILQREVLDIELGAHGPQAVLTDAGRLEVETLVLCAGVHSGKFTAKLGDTVPLEAERGYHVTFSDPGLELHDRIEGAIGKQREPVFKVLLDHLHTVVRARQHLGVVELDPHAATALLFL